MALRGKEETFVRRFAAGGNDGVPFNPRGCGDHSRRFAARGNEIVDDENFRESCDGYHPRRFAARGNEDPDLIYDFSPVFDEYEDDVWYAWATGGSYRCGFDEAVRLNENSLSPKIAGMFDDLLKAPSTKNGGVAVVTGGDVLHWKDPCKLPKNRKGLTSESYTILSPTNLQFQIESNFKIGDNILVNKYIINSTKKMEVENTYPPNSGYALDYPYCHIRIAQQKKTSGASYNSIGPPNISQNSGSHGLFAHALNKYCGPPNLLSRCHGPILKSNELRTFHLDDQSGSQLKAKSTGLQPKPNANEASNLYSSLKFSLLEKILLLEKMRDKIQNGFVPLNSYEKSVPPMAQVVVKLFEQVKSIVHRRRSNAPFDPGGTSLELGEGIHEVELFRRIVIIIIQNRVDVPYDPGGFGPKAKLEDEFFRRRGE